MALNLNNLKGYAENTLRAVASLNAPTIFKGMLNEFLSKPEIDVNFLISLVEEDKSLWSFLPPEHYDKVIKVVGNIGDVKWFTADWLIEAIKKKHPAIASLFLGWRKGYNWLKRQVKQVKDEIQSLVS